MMGKNKIWIISILSMVLIAGSLAATTTIIGAILGIDQNWSGLLDMSNEVNNHTSDDSNQGVKLRFKPKREERENLVYIQTDVAKSVDGWVTMLEQFLEPYHNKSANRVSCSYTSGPRGDNQVCDVPVEDFHPCTAANKYNYAEGAPCIFLKLDKILNWQPQPYNSTENLPEDMPLDLKEYIRVVSGRPEANNLFVTCKGESEADEENLGPIQYIPRRGFPLYYFPDTNKEGYLSPLVAVLFEKPRKGVLINIECRLWARNIPRSGPGTSASVHVDLMIDRE